MPAWSIPSSVGKMAPGTYRGDKRVQPTERAVLARGPHPNPTVAPVLQVAYQHIDGRFTDDEGVAASTGNRTMSVNVYQADSGNGTIMAVLCYRPDGTSPAAPTLTSASVTWTSVDSVTFSGTGSDRYRLSAFLATGLPAGSSTTSQTITVNPNHAAAWLLAMFPMIVFTVFANSGASMLGQVATGSGSGAAPTVTPATTNLADGILILMAVATTKAGKPTPTSTSGSDDDGYWPEGYGIIKPAGTVLGDVTAWMNAPATSGYDRVGLAAADFTFSDWTGSPPLGDSHASGSGTDTSDGYGWIEIEVPAVVVAYKEHSMFDFGNAIVLGLVITGLVALARSLLLGTNRDRIVSGICLLVSFVGVQLVAASDFAAQQVLLEIPLNAMNFASQLVVALLGAGIASGIWQGFKAVKNVGENQP